MARIKLFGEERKQFLFLMMMFVISNMSIFSVKAQFPPAGSCISTDFQLVAATLTGGDACNTCTPGTEITRTLTLSIQNNTLLPRTSFAFWGTLQIFDGTTNTLKSSTPIKGCNGPISPLPRTSLSFGNITYTCGDNLQITNLYLAWSNSTCPLDSSLIAPQCGTLPSIVINSGVNGSFVVTNVKCFGAHTGAIDLSPTGGTGPYSYSWVGSNGGVVPSGQSTNQDLTGLVAGTYTVTITDSKNCTITKDTTVTQPASAIAVVLTSQKNTCFGESTGAINITASGGTPPYTYSWWSSPLVLLVDPDAEDQTGLAAGTYNVRVTDANGCSTAPLSVTITQPATALSSSITAQTMACYGSSTGSVTVAGSGGASPYSYSIDGTNFGSSGTFSGLAAGDYTITVKDANGCTTTQAVTITQPTAALSASITEQTNICFGEGTGSVTVAGAGGTAPYTYSIDGTHFGSSSMFGKLAAGDYTITVKDANGCTTTQDVTITQSAAPSASITAQTNVACFGDKTGSVTLAGSGGTAPYTYTIDGTSFNPSGIFSGLAAGFYKTAVKDANGCTTTQAVTITQPAAALSASITAQTNVDCFGNSTGSVTVAGYGGTSPYTYSIDGTNFGSSGSFSGLAAGNYTITVADANGCTTTQNVTITQAAAALSASITAQTNVDCNADNTGSVTVAGSGGTSPYSYSLDATNFGSSGTFSGLTAGSYTITVRDANSCTTTQAVTILSPVFCGGHFFHTGTTCSKFESGTTQLEMVCVKISKGRISNATPGVFFYYTYLTSPGGTFTVDIIQSATCGSKLFSVQKDQVNAWTFSGCTKIATGSSVTGNPSTGRITISGVPAGTQIVLSVKYDVKSIINGTLSSDPCNYSFVSKIGGVIQANSGGSLKVGSNCTSTTAPITINAPSDKQISPVDHLSVSAYPNPFTDKVTFSITSPVSGKASLDIYDILGQKLHNVYQGYLFAGRGQVIEYAIPSSIYKSTLIYTLKVGDQQVNGKLIQIK
ncbi:hypothetical protein FW778_13310 [Ginsengibacter hankyongi]|uniref:Por secretion system C-terminal sorting domain-containing protein n=1 Tax=Ginsengibacter hankyongi TaxID=2607284 RepID=A0A5J5IF93_9BACT|nr:hypothetical protein [Ginsengibacter hankyongi]KAA9038532.1 hypothetical protein FW778_13310 [Ginsengibacter hankyongi]